MNVRRGGALPSCSLFSGFHFFSRPPTGLRNCHVMVTEKVNLVFVVTIVDLIGLPPLSAGSYFVEWKRGNNCTDHTP